MCEGRVSAVSQFCASNAVLVNCCAHACLSMCGCTCHLQGSAASKWLSKHCIDPNDPCNALLLELLRAREAAAHSGQAVGAAGVFRCAACCRPPSQTAERLWLPTQRNNTRGSLAARPCRHPRPVMQRAALLLLRWFPSTPGCVCVRVFRGRLCVSVCCRLDLPNGLSLGVDRIADRRVAFIKQRWTAGPYRSSSTGAAGHDSLHGEQY